MPRRRHKPEEMVAKPRRGDELVLQAVADTVYGDRNIEATNDRWCSEFVGFDVPPESPPKLHRIRTEVRT
jgi:hypothetical protein